ncbi:MAG: UDP-N-acetylmuramate--L-alanine ligase [Microthrixaceae bacterium]
MNPPVDEHDPAAPGLAAAPDLPDLPDLSRPRRVHVVAAGGAGMSAIATVLAEQGHEVSGSDQVASETLARLEALGVRTRVGHDPAVVHGAELVVVSTAVGEDNVEVLAARQLGIPVLRRIDLLPAFARVQPFVSISGTHGKTTTSSMTAVALREAGARPSFLVGARVASLGTAAAHDDGRWFVLEADESDGSFLAGPRAAALVTNLEPDHLEYWGDFDALRAGMRRFLAETDGPRIVCVDDPEARRIGHDVGAVGYGTDADADYRITDLELGPDGSRWLLHTPAGIVTVELAVPGLHNATNAAGALALAGELGLDLHAAARGIGGYTGVARRFEPRGEADGVRFVDDYAHLPTEVRAALAAGRSGDWRRVVAVFQPHRYSRTQALWSEFADAFEDADVLVLTEIYPAGEAPRPGVTGELLVDAVRRSHPDARVEWCPTLDDVTELLATELGAGDLCLSLGAGDITHLADRVRPLLERRSAE